MTERGGQSLYGISGTRSGHCAKAGGGPADTIGRRLGRAGGWRHPHRRKTLWEVAVAWFAAIFAHPRASTGHCVFRKETGWLKRIDPHKRGDFECTQLIA